MKLRWLMLKHNYAQWVDGRYLWLSTRLPKRLRMWVFTTVFGSVMSQSMPNTDVHEPSAMDVYGYVANEVF